MDFGRPLDWIWTLWSVNVGAQRFQGSEWRSERTFWEELNDHFRDAGLNQLWAMLRASSNFVDKCGLSDWEERKDRPVIIPAEARAITLHYPINQHIRHQSLICCVTAAGNAYCPFLVSSDPSGTPIFEHGVRDGIDFGVKISPSSYVRQALSEKSVDAVPIPALESNRKLPGCEKKRALLFCDNCRAHYLDDVLTRLVRHGVIAITCPLHASHIF
jgi:hypothetical protein